MNEAIKVLVNEKSLAKLLFTIGEGMTTRRLYEEFGAMELGQDLLKEAVRRGYVVRKDMKKDEGKGRPYVWNILTPAGKEIADAYKEITQ